MNQALRMDLGGGVVVVVGYSTDASFVLINGRPVGKVVDIVIELDPKRRLTRREITLYPSYENSEPTIRRLAGVGFDVYVADLYSGNRRMAMSAQVHDDMAIAIAAKEPRRTDDVHCDP